MFSQSDLLQLQSRGSSYDRVLNQLNIFKQGLSYSRLVRSTSVSDGILRFDDDQVERLLSEFPARIASRKVLKFVPASGAASRMFKQLCEFQSAFVQSPDDPKLWENKGTQSMAYFWEHIRDFAFFEELKMCMQEKGLSLDTELEERRYATILDFLLTDKGLDYLSLPKGLLTFHRYGNTCRTALEEHLVEGALYAAVDKRVCLHFTVSPEHLDRFKARIAQVIPFYQERFGVEYSIEYSLQKKSTDTIAVTLENEPFRADDGRLLFRPGGHGALIENLNDLQGDLIFIKNIDNVTTDRRREPTLRFKKILASYLLQLQEKNFAFLRALEEENVPESVLMDAYHFAWEKLCLTFTRFEDFSRQEKRKCLQEALNRPMRICGMVKNEGEPGGGPFWTENSEGKVSLQIVESSQIDFSDEQQKEIASKATHFNPVDLVCAVRNYQGEPFDLNLFVDPETGFISEKSLGDKRLRALELPGLWNGAMAHWITLFVEVPMEIFSPVKTIQDLLREEHR